jgi:hypothetical protein
MRALFANRKMPPDASMLRARGSAPGCTGRYDNHPELFPEVITVLLKAGIAVRFKAPGHSMRPVVRADEIIRVAPILPQHVCQGDIILYTAGARLIAHRVIAVPKTFEAEPPLRNIDFGASADFSSRGPSRFILRGDAAHLCDPPIGPNQVLGKVVAVERNGRLRCPYRTLYRFSCLPLLLACKMKIFLQRLVRT